jgi:hypothetical protein
VRAALTGGANGAFRPAFSKIWAILTQGAMVALIILTVFSPAKLFALGKRDAPPSPPQAEGAELPDGACLIRGRVRVWGSEPHTFAGIETTDDKRYAVFPAEKEKEIRDLQGNLIEFTVIFSEKPQGYGSLFLPDGTVTPLSWRILPQSSK